VPPHPPGTSDSPPISPSFSSGQRNRAYWASQPQKSVTLQPQPEGETTKSERPCVGIEKKTFKAYWLRDASPV